MSKLNGKIAVVTGGNSGIGLATAIRFAAEGAQVVIVGRRQSELDKALTLIGPEAIAIQADIAKLDDLDRVFTQVKAAKGRVDILFANAGLGDFQPIGSITEESFDRTFGINVKGTLFTVQKALPLMQAGGSVILTGSTTGTMGTAAFSVYSATKAALRNFARSWALDLKGTGIRVNVLSPGPISTPGLDSALSGTGQKEAIIDDMTAQVPLGRIGQPEEVAAAALFLASDESSFMTGSEMFVDGGFAQV
ncbi:MULTISPECIES: SDR family NAD(P)-dependent oxidoreductase [unclassified Pseudomonas]|jgi:NAD(P)-dependent dehydrogenase (short-subunit alcohol dehydrogenase family)|uniref:SDR family NAD(P)-dependent oxidoreductase n=1 Tax=unclassified Pseudomonas TaxID=196821 RepID=UPI0008DEC8F5|nr:MULTISPECIES: glucose 1-dehydrogenase [unclassified Pseudomonas]SFB35741.1 NAD(P)-dependent dehydrogenase, short-chain alcohol dehydrogenase family [Pseudomonas sp. NFPP24]SFI12492.1 NAD(P)-dependent dehydrogenase, short-chain alcohol dehydrogenase family [Pseudomonas sp. NFPP04]SFI61606.1 NAD(P)-dependent dehydrogenase, short-chain alcohol dehydrogenase family [Pseudomonas sp. NFPP11]SFP12679.1 NAD(P)-dependent dehydrogenase, short-chain alcohol dehydrogenase family [Pseudomonas sp. NFPP28]